MSSAIYNTIHPFIHKKLGVMQKREEKEKEKDLGAITNLAEVQKKMEIAKLRRETHAKQLSKTVNRIAILFLCYIFLNLCSVAFLDQHLKIGNPWRPDGFYQLCSGSHFIVDLLFLYPIFLCATSIPIALISFFRLPWLPLILSQTALNVIIFTGNGCNFADEFGFDLKDFTAFIFLLSTILITLLSWQLEQHKKFKKNT